MKFGKLYLLLVLFVLSSWNSVFAQSVTFSDIRLEHNVPDNSGRKMLQFHYKMSVNGCKGHNIRLYFCVDIPQNVSHYYADGNIMCAESESMYCNNETAWTKSGWIGIYNDLLNPRPGTNTYYAHIAAWDETLGRNLGWSDFLSFDNTGNDNSVASSGGSAQKATVQNVWVEYVDGKDFKKGGYKIHTKFDVSGMLKKQIKVIAYFYDANKNPVFCKKINPLIVKLLDVGNAKDQFVCEGYRTSDNQISTSETSKPNYENTTYNDFSLFLPLGAITPYIPIEKATYLVKVRVYDTKNKVFLSDSEPYASFPAFGTSWDFLAEKKEEINGSKIENKGKLVRTIENDDNGSYSCTFVYDSGWKEYLNLTNCFICNSTGKTSCIPCLGTGYTTQYAYPNIYRVPCSSCGRKGYVPCSVCGGLGISVTVNAFNEKLHLQYVDGKFSPYYPTNGTPTQSSYSNQPIINQPIPPTYTREKIECPSCHGRKVCKHCGGTGKVQRENGYTGYTEWKDCVMCNGSGTCQACNGKGSYY